MAYLPGSVPLPVLATAELTGGQERPPEPFNNGSPVTSPNLPYNGELPKLNDGFMMCVKGQFWSTAKQCTIQFLHQPDDVAFMTEFYFDQDKISVLRNSFLKGSWGDQVTDQFTFTPKRGDIFEIIFLVTSVSFKCSINGHPAFDFPHRCPLDDVNAYKISGHFHIARISFQVPKPALIPNAPRPDFENYPKRWGIPDSGPHIFLPQFFPGISTPASAPPPGFLPSYMHPLCISSSSIPMPTCNPESFGHMNQSQLSLPHGLLPGQMINFYGIPTLNCTWFQISLRTSAPTGDSALVIRISFSDQAVTRNSIVGGVPELEERFIPCFPFAPGATFSIFIFCLPDLFKMAVNQVHFIDFQRRSFGPEDVRSVEVEGGVVVTSLFKTGGPDFPRKE